MMKKARKSNLAWVGSRYSDIGASAGLFDASITLYGDNSDGNISFCKTYGKRINNNIENLSADGFFFREIQKLINENEDLRFMFYNPLWAFKIEKLSQYRDNFLCLNDPALLRSLESKIRFRSDFEESFSFIPATIVRAEDLSADMISDLLSRYGKPLVFQKEISSGGAGTFLTDECNFDLILKNGNERFNYVVSKYLENSTSLNAHVMIFKNEIIIFPGSVQIIEPENNYLLYKGGDYIAFKRLSEKKKKKFRELVHSLALKLQERGFRGICGIDALIDTNDVLYLMEVNPRFQGSTNVLDMALANHGYDSIFIINCEAFVQDDAGGINLNLSNFTINYSCYSIINNDIGKKTIMENVLSKSNIICEVDGYDEFQQIDDYVYMYKLIFNDSFYNDIKDIGGVLFDIAPSVSSFDKSA